MPATYEPISTTTLGSTASSVTFSSIPGTYTDLVLVTSNTSSAGLGGVYLDQINGDTGTNYSSTKIFGTGSTAGSDRNTSDTGVNIALSNSTQCNNIFHFLNYSNTTTFKTVLARGNSAGGQTRASVALFRSTAAITSFRLSGVTFDAGSTFTLYGILKAQTMANTFIKIASVTVGAGGASSMAFTSIPATYTDLVLKVSARRSDSSEGYLSARFNSDSGSNYSNRTIRGTGTAASSSTSSSDTLLFFWVIDGTGYTANTFASADIYIPNYTSANQKSISAENAAENNATGSYMQITAGLWSGTAAITAITLYANESATGTFGQYSTATLYGIKKN